MPILTTLLGVAVVLTIASVYGAVIIVTGRLRNARNSERDALRAQKLKT